AAASPPGKLRIALSAKPGVLGVRVKDSVRTAVDETAQVLRSLGHEVTERDPAYGDMRPPFTPRWLRGIRDDAAAMPDPGQLEARTRSLARLGGVVGERGVRAAPVGVQLVGRSGDEATLLSLAAQLEAEIGWLDRCPPVD